MRFLIKRMLQKRTITNHTVFVAIFILTILILPFSGHSRHVPPKVLLQEQFEDLANWEPLSFPDMKKPCDYSIVEDEEGSYLKAKSEASASGLKYRETFDVFEYSNARWRWKAENVYEKGNLCSKEGNDFPLRIYIVFKYDPNKAGFFTRLKYSSAKLLFGEYPPHSALNYIWANKDHGEKVINSPNTRRSKLITKRGLSDVGSWQNEEVNILDDYRKAFGEDPPKIASVIVMNDSDDTGECSVSYIDYIEVYQEPDSPNQSSP